MNGNMQKETDTETETEKLIYYDFRRFHDVVRSILYSIPNNYFRCPLNFIDLRGILHVK